MIVAVTGSGGFIGSHLTEHLRSIGISVREVNLRSEAWEASLRGATVLLHLAGTAHSSIRHRAGFDISEHGDVLLARRVVAAAASSGVQHLVHVSSIKARGGNTVSERSQDEPLPSDDYGQLKRAVEMAVIEEAATSGLPVWIARLPLVYGPRVRANFLLLLNAVARGWPLPLRFATATRSYLGIRNLCSALCRCIELPPRGTVMIDLADHEPLSTRDLVRLLARLLNSRVVLLPIPRWIMKVSLRLLGKSDVYDRLFEELAVDSQPTRDALNWSPPFTTREELEWTIHWYSDSHS